MNKLNFTILQQSLMGVIPHLLMEGLGKYFRLEIEGEQHIKFKGQAIFSPNHSGFSGFDAMLLTHNIQKINEEKLKVLTHYFWFLNPMTAEIANKLGFVEAKKDNAEKFLNQGHKIILFPEGEYGNFKPSLKAYKLREFKRGFVRLALKTKTPIIPTIVIGAEESNINLTQIELPEKFKKLVLPLPLNIVPLPARWKIKFLAPIYLPYNPTAADDSELVHEITSDIKEQMQKSINKELKNRNSIYF